MKSGRRSATVPAAALAGAVLLASVLCVQLAVLRSRWTLVVPAMAISSSTRSPATHTLGEPPAPRAEHLSERELGR